MNKETEALLAIAYELIAISETIRKPRESGTIYGPVLKGGSGGGPLNPGGIFPGPLQKTNNEWHLIADPLSNHYSTDQGIVMTKYTTWQEWHKMVADYLKPKPVKQYKPKPPKLTKVPKWQLSTQYWQYS